MRIILSLLLVFLSGFNTNCKKSTQASPSVEPPSGVSMLKPVLVNVLDAQVNETSGLIFFDNSFWTINDSGNENILYRIDAKTGSVSAEIKVTNSTNIDWEELTQDQDYVYVADIGDNGLKREEKQIYRIRKSELLQINGNGDVSSEVIRFSYPAVDGKVVSFDAEALIAYKGALHLFTKDLFETNHFEISASPGTTSAVFIGKYKSDGMVTGAAVDVSSNTLVMVGYMGFGDRLLWEFKASDDKHFFKLPARTFTMGSVTETGQVEAVCLTPENKLYFTNESFGAVKQQLWTVTYPIK
jgi:outer membrane protein assembly factor BamB